MSLLTSEKLAYLTSQNDFNYRRLKLVEPLEIADDQAPFYLIGCEAYNPGNESVILVNEIIKMSPIGARYIAKMDGNLGQKYIEIKPDSFGYMSHQFYTCYTVSGSPITLVKHYGNAKFKGHKTQSAPEPFKKTY